MPTGVPAEFGLPKLITRDTVKLNNARARGAIFQLPGADGKNQPIGVIALRRTCLPITRFSGRPFARAVRM